MATRPRAALADQIRDHNHRLASELESSRLACTAGINLQAYKVIKNTAQLAAILAGFYAIHQGADPLQAFGLVSMIWLGPEYVEYKLTNGNQDS